MEAAAALAALTPLLHWCRSLRSQLLEETGRSRSGPGLEAAAALAALTRVAMALLQLLQPLEEGEEEEEGMQHGGDAGGGSGGDDYLTLKDGEARIP